MLPPKHRPSRPAWAVASPTTTSVTVVMPRARRCASSPVPMKFELTLLVSTGSPGRSAASGSTATPSGQFRGWKGLLGSLEWCRMWMTGREAARKAAMILAMFGMHAGVLDLSIEYIGKSNAGEGDGGALRTLLHIYHDEGSCFR
ncbi:hypothetical protein LshimejAT787_1204520 [Lyophyllum shimeji]|uniref:Uncharacterized protein n=1 Tax=Lyophyllum shimeji TaxID=47721 RepID=A0A9P3PVY3_LYOSH|nr:hypothetical protein LshimejAT787_1204520 [Lyophyllum shimeji]